MWILLAVALILRAGLVAATLYTPTSLDPADFSRSGLAISQGHFPDDNRAPGGGPSAFRPPLYPILLGGLYWVIGQEAPPAARALNAVLGTIAVALIGVIARQIWGRRIGVLALGIAAMAPPLVVLSTALVSEALFVPLMLASVAATLQAARSERPLRWAILAGILLGLAELTRTNAVIILPVLAWAVWRARRGEKLRRSLRRPAVLALATVLTVVPWTIRNALVLHSFVPVSTEIGYTLAGTYDQASMDDHHWPGVWKEAEHGASPEYSTILFYANIYRWGEVKLGNELLAQAIKEIKAHPAYMFTVVEYNAIRMFHLGELDFGIPNLRDTGIEKVPAWFEVIGFWALGLLALLGLAANRVRRAPVWLWLVPVLLASTLFVTGFVRFRSGIDPFLVLLAAVGIAALRDRFARRRAALPAEEAAPEPERTQATSAITTTTMTSTTTTAAAMLTGRWVSQNLGLARSRV